MDVLATSFSNSSAKAGDNIEFMRSQAEELEAVFLNTLVSEMFASVKSDEGDFGEETWRGMQSEQYAAAMAKDGGIGIADQIMRSLLSAQESAQHEARLNTNQSNPYTNLVSGNQS